jgi:methyltransferase (TIGR00027 family)
MKPGKPSNTALIVAAGLQLVRPTVASAPVLPMEAIRRGAGLLRTAYPRIAGLLGKPWFRSVCRAMERSILPGISLHFALRKRILRDHAHAAIAGGCRQVVVLGAGLDTLCAELAGAYPQVCCIESDHPATQSRKRRVAGEGAEGVHYIAVDLAQHALATVLEACPAFRGDVSTLFVAEGLLMYLPLHAVSALFTQMVAAAPDVQVAFTWLEPQADGRPNFTHPSRLVDFWLRVRGEPFLSGLARAELGRFLGDAGLVLKDVNDSDDLLRDMQQAAPGPGELPIVGEYICLAGSNDRKRA